MSREKRNPPQPAVSGPDRAETETAKWKNDLSDHIDAALLEAEAAFQAPGGVTGVSTGLAELDELTAGFHPGDLIVLGARPSVGKTALSAQIAGHAVLDLGLPAGVFSLELAPPSWIKRLLCSRARANLRKFHDREVMEHAFPKLTGVAGKLVKSPLHLAGQPGLTLEDLKQRALQMREEAQVRLLVIDYLQMLRAGAEREFENREQETAWMAQELKRLAMTLRVPILLLSQLNREVEHADPPRQPCLWDLRDSGAIEESADVVILMRRFSAGYDEEIREARQGWRRTEIMVAKQRCGPIGEFSLRFFPHLVRFEPDDQG